MSGQGMLGSVMSGHGMSRSGIRSEIQSMTGLIRRPRIGMSRIIAIAQPDFPTPAATG